MNKEEFVNKIVNYVKTQNPGVASLKIDEKTNLVSEGIVDSLTMVSLIVYVEELMGEPIDFDTFDIKDAQSIDSLYNTLVVTSVE